VLVCTDQWDMFITEYFFIEIFFRYKTSLWAEIGTCVCSLHVIISVEFKDRICLILWKLIIFVIIWWCYCCDLSIILRWCLSCPCKCLIYVHIFKSWLFDMFVYAYCDLRKCWRFFWICGSEILLGISFVLFVDY
jgi:hypothetical protein